MSSDIEVQAGSADLVPSTVTVNGAVRTDHDVQLVPFVEGTERYDDTAWVHYPMNLADVEPGFYCIYTAVMVDGRRVIDHAPQHLSVR